MIKNTSFLYKDCRKKEKMSQFKQDGYNDIGLNKIIENMSTLHNINTYRMYKKLKMLIFNINTHSYKSSI